MRTKTLDSFLFQLGQSVDISPNRAEIHLFDGQRRRVVIVENIMPGGEPTTIQAADSDEVHVESPREAAIMRIINGLGIDDRVSAEEIARLAGYSLCGSMRDLLRDMVKREKIASFGRAGFGRFPS